MKKMVEEKTGMVLIGDAVIPCDTTPNTSKTFDTPLIANLGETVFYLNPEFKNLQDNGNFEMSVSTENIIEGIVCQIDYATGCSTCLKMREWNSGKKYEAAQELFFRSFEEAAEVVEKVNKYTGTHSIWGGDWYEIYKRLFRPVYRYTLKFRLTPLQTQKIRRGRGWHYIIPNRVIATIQAMYRTEWYHHQKVTHCIGWDASIEYQGKDTKPEYIDGKQIIGTFKDYYANKYEIVPIDESN